MNLELAEFRIQLTGMELVEQRKTKYKGYQNVSVHPALCFHDLALRFACILLNKCLSSFSTKR